jgi:hypothetical protein
MKKILELKLSYFELMDGKFVGFLITVQNFRQFALV